MNGKENLLIALILGLLGGLIVVSISQTPNTSPIKEEHVAIVDSVWSTSPGQENTLQTDYHYYYKLSNGQVIKSNDRAFHIGDSIQYIYHRYENTKKEKKH